MNSYLLIKLAETLYDKESSLFEKVEELNTLPKDEFISLNTIKELEGIYYSLQADDSMKDEHKVFELIDMIINKISNLI